MAQYWLNDDGYAMLLLDLPSRKAQLTLYNPDRRPILSSTYEWWNTRRAATDAHELARMSLMFPVSEGVFYGRQLTQPDATAGSEKEAA